jgi:hypothetical protein
VSLTGWSFGYGNHDANAGRPHRRLIAPPGWEKLTAGSKPAETVRAYPRGWRDFTAWCQNVYRSPLSADPHKGGNVEQFNLWQQRFEEAKAREQVGSA